MPSLIAIILQHKKLIAVVAVAVAVVSAAVSLVLPQRWVATVTFVPAGVEQEITGAADFFTKFGSFGDAYRTIVRVKRNSLVNVVVRSRTLAMAMDERFGLAERYGTDGVEELRREFGERTSLMVTDEGSIILGIEAGEAETAAVMAGACVEIVDSVLVAMAVEGADEERRFLEEEIARRERRIEEADSAISRFMTQHRLYGFEAQARAMVEVGAFFSAQLDAVEIEKRLLQTTLREGNPRLVSVERRLDALREELVRMRTGEDEHALFPPLREMPALGARYLGLMAGRRVEEFAVAFLRLRLAEARFDANNTGSVLRMIDPPMVPERRAWPKRSQIVLFSTAAAIFWTCFVLLAIERRRRGAAS